MITSEILGRFERTVGIAAKAGSAAIHTYGHEAQERMAIEEMGELLSTIMQTYRDRLPSEEVVREAADVIITAIQIGMIYGSLDELNDAIASKTERLRERISERRKREVADG